MSLFQLTHELPDSGSEVCFSLSNIGVERYGDTERMNVLEY